MCYGSTTPSRGPIERKMKLLGQRPSIGEPGKVTLDPDLDEDIWHLYNLMSKGDKVTCSTARWVQFFYLSVIGLILNN